MNPAKFLMLISLMLLSAGSAKAENWMTSLEDAKMIALTTNKFILVDFWAPWCKPCKRMEIESWSDLNVQVLMNYFVPVKIDIDIERQLAHNYDVKSIPYIFIMDANGKVIHKELGYKSKSQVISFLKEFTLSSEFMAIDLINYHKNQNMANSFRLGAKYQDFSLRLDRSLKRDFLTVSQDYFNEAKKYLKEKESADNLRLIQKIELYEINEFLILDKADKALRQLEKIDLLETNNEDFYNFLNFVAHSILKDDRVEYWTAKVDENSIKKAQLYLNKN